MSLSKNIYIVPFKADIMGISDPRAHFAHFKYAVDFPLPEGTIIFAAASGKVTDVKVNSKEGGADPKYNDIRYVNYVTLQHRNGEYSQYAHLKHNGVLVKVGETVKKGQPIAISGNTGLSTAPHLHFQVLKLNKTAVGWETLKIRFNKKITIDKSQGQVPKSHQKICREIERVRKSLKT